MVRKSKALPEVGELVIGTVTMIEPHGAYVRLDEYNGIEGMIHISEIASTWVRNIRNHVREDQKVVVKVLRVDESKRQIDLSLRRVTEQQKKTKIQEFKRAQKAENLLKLAAERLNKTLDDGYNDAGWPLENAYGEIYAGFEEAKEKGKSVLQKAGVKKEWIDVLMDIINQYVEVPKVKIAGILELRCFKKDGVNAIKNALLSAMKVAENNKDAQVNIYVVGSPKYRVEVIANDYKSAESVLQSVVKTALDAIKEAGGEGKWIRQ
ncbi:MAG: translation initiation factor IF-2 subunit alpha [Candidatus Odinarchaeia archaeon]